MDILSLASVVGGGPRDRTGEFSPLLHVCLLDCKRNYTHTERVKNTLESRERIHFNLKYFNTQEHTYKVTYIILLHSGIGRFTSLFIERGNIHTSKQTKQQTAMHFPTTCIH